VHRSAFTLIELLVVIAILAILAAILFPAFGQAKVAAKKIVGLSNQKQISLAILMYATDHNDGLPKDDECIPDSSLNPALNDGEQRCDGDNGFAHRWNHFSWQKLVQPYMRATEIFVHPLRERDPEQWSKNGQITNSFVLNIAVSGSLDVYKRPANFPRQFRESWLGESLSSFPSPSELAVLMELPGMNVPMLPAATVDGEGVNPRMVAYPIAVREFWRWKLMDGNQADCVARTKGTQHDSHKIAAGGIVVGFCDGSARFLTAGKFLAMTPSKSEYLGADPSSSSSGWTYPLGGAECNSSAVGNYGFTSTPNTKIQYPLWGLGS